MKAMTRLGVWVIVSMLLVMMVSTSTVMGAIPRACSTPDSQKYPFCDTKLSIDDRVKNLVSLLLPAEKPGWLTARTNPAIARLGIPEYNWGANCIHGVQSRCGARCPTSFPTPSALGASFNKTLWWQISSIVGHELRALYLQAVGENRPNGLPLIGLDCWSPNININRDPRWGRNQEVASEDPYINGQYGVASTKGLQEGEDPRYILGVITLKHWDAYSLERYNNVTRHNFNAIVSNYDFTNTYFPAFKASVIDGKAKGVMCSYNAINGVPTCASQFLNATLRGDWGFDGYVVSDSGAISDIYYQHHYTQTPVDAVKVALTAGTDINSGSMYNQYMNTALQQGKITNADIDLALTRTIKLKFQLGLFDPIDDQPYWKYTPDSVNNEFAQSINLLATRESLVLLKNEGRVLPLPRGKRIAVLGPHGNATGVLVGNYIGQICPKAYGDFSCITTPFQAIKAHNAGGTTVYAQGCSVTGSSKAGYAAALAAARASDYLVLFLGTDLSVENEDRDRYNITLPGVQDDFFSTVMALGKPTIVVLINGGTLAVPAIKSRAQGIIEAFFPGFLGGVAIADVLFGDYNPGGKLPVTVYDADYVKQVDFLSMDMTKPPGRTYRYFVGQPLWEFGYGLSYTNFTLQWSTQHALPTHLSNLRDSNSVSLTVNVTNIGTLAGDEVVQAYFKPDAKTIKQLFGFERVHLQPKQSRLITFDINRRTLQVGNNRGDLVSHVGPVELWFTNGLERIGTTLEVVGREIALDSLPKL